MSLDLARRMNYRASLMELDLPDYAHDPAERRALEWARAHDASAADLSRLQDSEDEAVRMAVIENPASPRHLLEYALRKAETYGPREAVLRVVAVHPNTNEDDLRAAVAEGDELTRRLGRRTLAILACYHRFGWIWFAALALIAAGLFTGGLATELWMLWLIRVGNAMIAGGFGLFGLRHALERDCPYKVWPVKWLVVFGLLSAAAVVMTFHVWPLVSFYQVVWALVEALME